MLNNFWFLVFTLMHLVTFCVGFVVYGTHYRARTAAKRAYIFSFKWCVGIGTAVFVISLMRHGVDLLYRYADTLKW